MKITRDDILSALSKVIDPDLQKDIVSLGFVKVISLNDCDVYVEVELTTPACPMKDRLREECVTNLKNLGITGKVEVKMTSNVISHKNEKKEAILPGVKNTIAVASGKGGVGKSTVAVSLAVSLAMEGVKVGLIDADIYGPSIPLMMGTNGEGIKVIEKNGEKKLIPLERYGVKLMSIGFLIDPDQAVIWRGPMASGALRQFMSDVIWGDLDYLIFDMPPGTGDIQLTLAQTIPLTGAVIITTPQDISLADARKGLKMFEKVQVPVFGIIENMSYFICSHCGGREDIFSSGGGRKAAHELNVPFLGEIPISTNIRIGGDLGKPVVFSDPDTDQSKTIRNIAKNLAAQISINHVLGKREQEIEISLEN
jgi:ATP-binding protein involved in chromosome partitioning